MQQIAGRMRDAAHQQRFLAYLEVLSVEAGQVLIEQGEASDGLLFVDRVVSRRTDLFRRKVYKKGGKKA